MYSKSELTPDVIKVLADQLNNLFITHKYQWEKNRTDGTFTANGFESDFPGIVYANLTNSQMKMLEPIFDLAGWSKVKLNEQGHTAIENTVHGPQYITTYFKVFYGQTR